MSQNRAQVCVCRDMASSPRLHYLLTCIKAQSQRIQALAPPSMQFSVPKDDKKSGGTSVLDKPVVDTSPKADDKLGKDKMYHVLLFNDVRILSRLTHTSTRTHKNTLAPKPAPAWAHRGSKQHTMPLYMCISLHVTLLNCPSHSCFVEECTAGEHARIRVQDNCRGLWPYQIQGIFFFGQCKRE
jgi:hypothetical protein